MFEFALIFFFLPESLYLWTNKLLTWRRELILYCKGILSNVSLFNAGKFIINDVLFFPPTI